MAQLGIRSIITNTPPARRHTPLLLVKTSQEISMLPDKESTRRMSFIGFLEKALTVEPAGTRLTTSHTLLAPTLSELPPILLEISTPLAMDQCRQVLLIG